MSLDALLDGTLIAALACAVGVAACGITRPASLPLALLNALVLASSMWPAVAYRNDLTIPVRTFTLESLWLWSLLCAGLWWSLRSNRPERTPRLAPWISAAGMLAFRAHLLLVQFHPDIAREIPDLVGDVGL